MKSTVLATLLTASVAFASPTVVRRADTITDVDILNYALTLEHLEDNFYSGALAMFSTNESFSQYNVDRGRFQQIADHEAAHVAFLTKALGNNAVAACNYSFPYTDIPSFIALASVLESVGVSAYLGAAALITNPAYLTAAASILTTESRHQAYIATVDQSAPWSGAFDTPQSLDNVYSLAAGFITGCPEGNAKLPVKAFPKLNVTSGTNATAGSQISFSFSPASTNTNSSSPSNGTQTQTYIAFFSGLNAAVVPISGNTNASVTIPGNMNGTVFAVVTTSSNTSAISDANTLAGPAILNLGGLNVEGGANGTGILNVTTSGTGSGGDGGSGSGGGSGGGKKGGAEMGVKSVGAMAGLVGLGLVAVLV